jgi:LemA protein
MSISLIVIIVVAIIVIAYFVSTQRELVNLDEMCKNALSQLEETLGDF